MNKLLKEYLAKIGSLGGSVKSKKKAEAARKNGRKPKKKTKEGSKK